MSDPAGQPSSIPRQDITSVTNKCQRQISHSSQSPGQQPSDGTSSITTRDTLTQPQEACGSARDTAGMHPSSTPPESSNSGSIKYTRTGRVSKAAKGQRVHHCEECGKTYTRAEHLRRHQQNHKLGAFPCDWANCGRSFYREDLLVRHRARHNDPNNPPSRRQSITSQSSSADFGRLLPGSSQANDTLRNTSETSVIVPELQQDAASNVPQQSTSRTLKRVPIPPNELPLGVPLAIDGPMGCEVLTNPWEPSPPLSPGYNTYDYESNDETSDPFFYQPQMARARNCSGTSFLGYSQPHSSSRSPVPIGPSTQMQRWSFQAGCDAQYLSAGSSFVDGSGYSNPEYVTDLRYRDSRSAMAEASDLAEHAELALLDLLDSLPGCLQDDDDASFPVHQQYLEAYWSQVHEMFTIAHRPSFDHETASPLLRASMLALGGQASGDRTDLSNARTIHEKCIKVLKQRTLGVLALQITTPAA